MWTVCIKRPDFYVTPTVGTSSSRRSANNRGHRIFIIATIKREQIHPDSGTTQVLSTACKVMALLNPDA